MHRVMCIMCIYTQTTYTITVRAHMKTQSGKKPLHTKLQFGGSSTGGQRRHSAVVKGKQIVNTPSAKVALQDLYQQVPEEHTHGFACVCVCVCKCEPHPNTGAPEEGPAHLHYGQSVMPYPNVYWCADAMALCTVWAVIDHSLKWYAHIRVVMRLD